MLATQVFRSVSSFPVYSAAFFSCLFSSSTSVKRTFRDAISVNKSSSLSILASNLVILAEASQQWAETVFVHLRTSIFPPSFTRNTLFFGV